MNTVEMHVDQAGTILAMLRDKGHARYGAEGVNQLQHALQCAAQAETAGASPALIVAALLHDIGHLVADDEDAAPRGVDAHHENVAARYLARWFPAEVVEPVRLHVAAKRYLCAAEPAYRATLSFASERSLLLQGGPFSIVKAEEFRRAPHGEAAIQLRRWDDKAKDPATATPGLEHYEPMVREFCRA